MKKINFILILIFLTSAFIFSKSITIISPSKNTTWYIGDSYKITWRAYKIPKSEILKVEILKNNFPVYQKLTSNKRFYYLTIPSNFTSGQYRIRMSTKDKKITSLSYPFTITRSSNPREITVISPNGGEVLYKNNFYRIKWKSNRLQGNVRIALYKNGAFLGYIASNQQKNGSFLWRAHVLGNGFKIKIDSTANHSIFDFSDSPFSIVKKDPRLIKPRTNIKH